MNTRPYLHPVRDIAPVTRDWGAVDLRETRHVVIKDASAVKGILVALLTSGVIYTLLVSAMAVL